MTTKRVGHHWVFIFNHRQWYFGFWWWPVPKDLAIGLCFGPFHLQWLRDPD